MIEIICYGDSNTYGYCPAGVKERYNESERWTGILQAKLGGNFLVHNEGLNGRTTDLDDLYDVGRNGASDLPKVLGRYPNADILILMLGTNDLKSYFRRNAEDIAKAAGKLAELAKQLMKKNAKIILVSPVLVGESMGISPFVMEFGAMRSREESLRFAKLYKKEAEKLGIDYLNAASYAKVSKEDSLHLSVKGHNDLAAAFERKIIGDYNMTSFRRF